jgi:hypothetical protein
MVERDRNTVPLRSQRDPLTPRLGAGLNFSLASPKVTRSDDSERCLGCKHAHKGVVFLRPCKYETEARQKGEHN